MKVGCAMKYDKYAKVLVVDDVTLSHDVIKHYMKPYGIQVDCVSRGQQAVDAIREEKVIYNAVFIDQIMPEMDGIQTARHIRKIGTKYAGTIPLIAITANANIGNKGTFLIKGFQDFISKPIDATQLDIIIHRWVEYSTAIIEKSRTEGIFNKHIEGINMQRGIRHFRGDNELFVVFLSSFTNNVPELIKKN